MCYNSMLFEDGDAWWVSRNSPKMKYWGGASPGSVKCACGMTNSCASNCDMNDCVWRENSGLLTKKTHLPVKQLRFGDINNTYHYLIIVARKVTAHLENFIAMAALTSNS